MALEPLIGAIVYISLAKNRVSFAKVKLRNVYSHFKGMLLLFIPVLTTYLYSSMDKVMIGQMSTMSELGYYENATKALIAKNLATALSTVLVPRMANLIGQKNEIKFSELLNKSINIVLLLTIAFGFGTGAISTTFSVVFWGKSFIKCSRTNPIVFFGILKTNRHYQVSVVEVVVYPFQRRSLAKLPRTCDGEILAVVDEAFKDLHLGGGVHHIVLFRIAGNRCVEFFCHNDFAFVRCKDKYFFCFGKMY